MQPIPPDVEPAALREPAGEPVGEPEASDPTSDPMEPPAGPAPRRVALRVMYDGTDFVGWQRQARGRTVQEELEKLLGRLSGDRPVTVVGAGRTDSGVHAHGQVAHADIISRHDDAALLFALRRMAPEDLAVTEVATVGAGFHARFKACRRSYRYRIVFDPDPFLARYAWRLDIPLDREILAAAAGRLVGTHDFTALSKFNPDTDNPVCTVTEARWREEGNRLFFEISADRFLYGMVRMLVGLQVDVARGKRGLDDVDLLLARRARIGQSPLAPARGLSLVDVGYPESPFRSAR